MQSCNDHRFDPFGPEADGLPDVGPLPDTGFLPGLPMPPTMTPDTVRQLCKERSGRIFANHDRLRRILDRHELTIQKRWTKKTKHQRLQILLDGWPNMPPMHRPDFVAFRIESPAQRELGTQRRDYFIWPYINQEDLLKPKTLLLMLNSRGRHQPCDFAAADGEAIHLGMITKAIVPIFLNCHVVALNGMTSPEDYGKLIAWEDHEDAFDWFITRKQFMPGEALNISETQDRLMKFLVHCCEQLLHDIPPAELLDDKYPVQPEPTLKPGVEPDSGFDSLAIMAEEAPYRPPGRLDFGRIESLLAARTSAAEDQYEHRQEMLKDTNGKTHLVLQALNIGVFWERVVGTVLVSSHIELEIFSELKRQAEEVKRLQVKYSGALSPLKNLPEEYLIGILRFRFFLDQLAKEWLNDLKMSVAASPPMRRLFDLFFARMPIVVDELERLLRAEPRARDLVSGYVAARIGDLSILCECIRQLDIYQPWANGYEYASMDLQDGLKKDLAKWRDGWAGIYSTIRSKPMLANFRFANPSDKRFFYPTEKRRTKETVEALRRAEANLDAFWEKFDKCLHPRAGDLSKTALWKLLSQKRALQRTLEWVPPPSAPEQAKTNKPAVLSSQDDAINRPLSTLHFELYTSTAGKKSGVAAQPKTKVKKRGTQANTSSAIEPKTTDEQQQQEQQMEDAARNLNLQQDQQPTFSVDSRAFKVFRTLFFHPAVTSTPGEVSWNDFLHAMTSTGFRAENLYGSVWHFQPSQLDVERSIQFHEPHPVGKIPFPMARRIGRRRARAYGWFGGMFALEK
ncbi:hypothetical protein C8A03DRAFT_46958 [Achaetomium macrosporum]|uniref:Uncharacterized protein n=1 Tax=Achaetomium macrosporum TaxID=79813 RepID=A0AAN7C3R6_9PEZI|nr:hypothetical protein C8A03DRAFT_46958 [Achaetomium macrosporum]